jgi:hypothetical protein
VRAAGKRALGFVHVPHVLAPGSIDIGGLEPLELA